MGRGFVVGYGINYVKLCENLTIASISGYISVGHSSFQVLPSKILERDRVVGDSSYYNKYEVFIIVKNSRLSSTKIGNFW